MTSAVTSRPTHYATLGLEPGATEDQIQRAFAREMSAIRPRAFGGIAEVSIAYEVLRDPVRRKAYDESIGIAPKPKAPAKVQWQASPYLLRASARPSPLPEAVPQPRPDPTPPPPRKAEVAPRADIPAFVHPRPAPQPAEAQLGGEEAPIEWRKPAIVIGGAGAAVALIAAWAGSLAGNYPEPQPSKRVVKVALAPAEPFPINTAPGAVPVARAKAWSGRPARVASSRHMVRRPTNALAADETGPSSPQPAQPYYASAGSTVAEAPSANIVQASLPLPKSVIARTIGRIGYACGQVASATAVEGGAPGTFKVTCTSGHSYQAAPVRGRYRFRRLAGQ